MTSPRPGPAGRKRDDRAMPETTYLQIRGGDTDATRVVELPGAAIRVGRGAVCEVRLDDPDLAEVQCLLRRRGETWHVQPIGPVGLVSIEGEAVDHLRPLPADVPLKVGACVIVIRPEGDGFREPIEIDGSADSDLGAEHASRPIRPAGALVSASAAGGDIAEERLRRWQIRLEQRERWLQARQEEKKWESRWRAVGEGLRARVPTAAPREERRPEAGRSSASDLPIAPPVARIIPPAGRDARPIPATEAPALPNPALPALPAPSPEAPPVDDRPAVAPAAVEIPPRRTSRSLRLLGRRDRPPKARPVAPHEPDAPVAEPEVAATASPPATAAETASSCRFFEADPSGISWHHTPAAAVETAAPAPPAAAVPRSLPTEEVDPSRGAPTADAGFPDSATIFAAQGHRPVATPWRTPEGRRRLVGRPIPSDPLAPATVTLPGWIAAPAAAGVVVLVALGLALAVVWTGDNLSAGLAARAALRAEEDKPVPLDPVVRVETRWWRTTAGHLALWAAAIERSPESATRAEEVRDVLDSARRAAPLESSARYATAGGPRGADPVGVGMAVGLSRDVATLSLAGRALKRAGKAAPALGAYRRALTLAADADATRLGAPTFDDDSQVRRFRLPREEIVAAVIRDMAGAGDWTFAGWAPALPPRAVVRLAAAKLCREKGDPDAARAVAAVLAEDVERPEPGGLLAEHHAAQAEALALSERKAEAAARYRTAIGLADDDATRRRFRLALAEILASLGETRERAELLEAAKGADPTDEVTRRALDAQQFAGLK